MRDLAVILPGRVPHGRELLVASNDSAVIFRPGDVDSAHAEDEMLVNELRDVVFRVA